MKKNTSILSVGSVLSRLSCSSPSSPYPHNIHRRAATLHSNPTKGSLHIRHSNQSASRSHLNSRHRIPTRIAGFRSDGLQPI